MNSKLGSIIVIAMILLGFVAALVPPVKVVQAARGNPKLAAVACDLQQGSCTSITFATDNTSIKAGSMLVSKVDGTSVSNVYFAIVFAVGDQRYVQFDGSWFDLYVSKDGYSALSPDDIRYAGPFRVRDLTTAGLKKVTVRNPVLRGGEADFYIGKVDIGGTLYEVVIGSIPFDITPDYKYIKIFDGIASQVAVSAEVLDILPAIEIIPDRGPGGARVTIRGVALIPDEVVNITYDYVVFANGTRKDFDILVAQVRADAKGKFTYTFNIWDLKEVWGGQDEAIPYAVIDITVLYNKTGVVIDTVQYREYVRAFVELRSVKARDTAQRFVNLYRGSGSGVLIVEAYVFDKIVVAGSWWNPTDEVKFYIGTTLIGRARPNATGFFNTTLEVPELPMGDHTVRVENAGVVYTFKIRVLPTLVLIPEEGPVGTVVEARVYGFPANALVSLWWVYTCPEVEETVKRIDWIRVGVDVWLWAANIVNGTTGPDGKFNVTVKFKVPLDVGGEHLVLAVVEPAKVSTAEAVFKITPLIIVTPSEFANDGSTVTIIGTGLDPYVTYYILIDNQNAFEYVMGDTCGLLNLPIVAAGFRPGLHAVSLYSYTNGIYEFIDEALFMVTCRGDSICEGVSVVSGLIRDVDSAVREVRRLVESGNAMLKSVSDGVATISSGVESIKVRLDKLEPLISRIDGSVATISTSVGELKSDLAVVKKLIETSNAVLVELKNGIATISTDVGAIRVNLSAINPVITAIRGDVAYIRTEIGTIRANSDLLPVLLPEINRGISLANTAVEDLKKTSTDISKSLSDLGKTIDSKVGEISDNISNMQKDVATVKSDVSDVKANLGAVPGLATAVWIAVAFSVISAAAAIFVAITVMRKIAG